MLAVVTKDLRLEARNRDLIPSVILFALLVIVIFNFAFEPGTDVLNSPPKPSFFWTLGHARGELPTSTVSHFPVGV